MEPFTIDIPTHWTDEEALSVFEFIDEIREQIWDHYHLRIQVATRLTQQLESAVGDDLDQSGGQEDLGDEIIF